MDQSKSGYKLVIVGDTNVGKSSIMHRFAKNTFLENHETTIGAAFMVKTIEIEERSVKFEIWDTAGQERYRSLAPVYYRGAMAAIVVYDVTCYDSFEKAQLWVLELSKRATSLCAVVLAGNKIDMGTVDVTSEEASEYAQEEQLIFFETSAKTNYNIDEMFTSIAKRLPVKKPPIMNSPDSRPSLTHRGRNMVDVQSASEQSKSSCC